MERGSIPMLRRLWPSLPKRKQQSVCWKLSKMWKTRHFKRKSKVKLAFSLLLLPLFVWAQDSLTLNRSELLTDSIAKVSGNFSKLDSLPTKADSTLATSDSLLADSLLPLDTLGHGMDSLLPPFHLALSLSGELRWISFQEGKLFQNHLDSLYQEVARDSLNKEQGIRVIKTNFQQVSVTIPVFLGLTYRINKQFRLQAEAGYFYKSENAILAEGTRSTEYFYDWELIPIQTGLQWNLPTDFLTEKDFPQIFVGFQWVWVLQSSSILYQGKFNHAKWSNSGHGYNLVIGGRKGVWRGLELETWVGMGKLTIPMEASYKDWFPLIEEENFTSHMNSFQVGIRIHKHLF